MNNSLTERERQILAHASNGLCYKQIASALNINDQTVKNHAQLIFAKLGATNIANAVAIAIRNNII